MEIFRKSFRISASVIIFIALILLTVVFVFVFIRSSCQWASSVLGSLVAGLIVAIIQFIIAWQDFAQTEKLKKLKLIEVYYNRNEREKYADLIRNANCALDVMGVTASRLFKDFADTSSGASGISTVLIKALERGVKVRVLLPKDKYLPPSKIHDAEGVREKFEELRNQYQDSITIRYFDHLSMHSIFRIDDTCIIGPVFPELESRNTPALHVMNSSPIAVKYNEYFESEWKKLDEVGHA